MNNQKHLLWRAAFGPDLRNGSEILKKPVERILEELFTTSKGDPSRLQGTSGQLQLIRKEVRQNGGLKELSKEQKMEIRNISREGFKKLNGLWMDEMVNSKAQLREKMALFWHGHFACRINNVFFQEELLHIIRRNALGNFADLLKEVSKSAAMLSFLNNQQNRKKQPNENFARELMELFTLGRGNYSEQDVKETARAFTGWGFDAEGKFVFRQAFHDYGEKAVLGEKGDFSGEEVIDIILKNKKTARFITRKIIVFFLGEVLEEKNESWLTDRFYKHKYNISFLLNDLFSAEWFYDPKYMGSRIKSPVEWIAGIRRSLPLENANNDWQLYMQKLLGQVLFFPPNVAGWPGGTNWIDSSTLMYRMRWPLLLVSHDISFGKPKDDDDVQMGRLEDVATQLKGTKFNNGGRMAVKADWEKFSTNFNDVPANLLMTTLRERMLTEDNLNADLLSRYAERDSRKNFIRSLTIRLMGTPDYQLC